MMPRISKKSYNNLLLMNQLFLSAILLLILGIWLQSGQYRALFLQFIEKPAVEQPAAAIDKASITLDFGVKKRIFEGPIIDDETISQALKQAAEAGKISLVWKEVGGLPRLTGVDGYMNGDKFWVAYVNGKKLESALYETKIKSNDKILLIYQ